MLLSDDSSRFEDLFELATWEELQALLDENGPDELLRQVRAAGAADAEGRQPDPWPASLALSLAPVGLAACLAGSPPWWRSPAP
jgi:hypothetical protein